MQIWYLKSRQTDSPPTSTFEELLEVTSMLEANTKKWEAAVLERGIEKGIEKAQLEIVEKMSENNMSVADIRKITGLSLYRIDQIRKKVRNK